MGNLTTRFARVHRPFLDQVTQGKLSGAECRLEIELTRQLEIYDKLNRDLQRAAKKIEEHPRGD